MIENLLKRFEFARFCTLHRRSLPAILRWQGTHLRRIVQHAYKHVPMWLDILSRASLDETSVGGLIDLEKIPLTNKETYLGRMVEEYIDGSRPFVQIKNFTSGSSGQPFQSFLPEHYGSSAFEDFASLRFLLWKGKSLSSIAATKVARIRHKAYASSFRLGLKYTDFREDPKKVFLQLAAFQPEVLVAVPGVLFDIARMVESDKTLPKLAPRYVVSTSVELSPSMRSFIGAQFRSEIYDRYALGETAVVGTECRLHDGFHINSESVIVEITDALGKPLPHCESGNVVVTDLINYNMPFIRYDTGDFGILSFEPCPCGLSTPRLWLKGKGINFLTFGERLVSRTDFRVFYALMHDVFQYQIVKSGENNLLLRIVPGSSWGEETMNTIKENVQKFLGNDIVLSIEVVKSIPNGPTGKSSLVVDETISLKNSET